jgi:hypothetical protein
MPQHAFPFDIYFKKSYTNLKYTRGNAMVLPWILAGLVSGVTLVLLLYLGGALLRSLQGVAVALLAASVVLVLGLAAWAQARAARQAAVAATVAARGQTTATVGLTLLALLLGLVVLVAGGVIAYLMIRLRRLERATHPEENWRNNPEVTATYSDAPAWPNSARLPHSQTDGLLRDLIQLETLRLLQGYELTLAHNRPTSAFPPASPYSVSDDDFPLASQETAEEAAIADDDFPWDTWV